MNKLVFLAAFMTFICLPLAFKAHADTVDKIRVGQHLDQFENTLQARSQGVTIKAQEIVQEKKVEAGQYQERQEVTSQVFDKYSKESQQSAFNHMIRIYGMPFLIVAGALVILLVLWHQSI